MCKCGIRHQPPPETQLRWAHEQIKIKQKTLYALAREMGLSRAYLSQEMRRIGLSRLKGGGSPASGRRGAAVWNVTGPHDHIYAESVCVLCNQRKRG